MKERNSVLERVEELFAEAVVEARLEHFLELPEFAQKKLQISVDSLPLSLWKQRHTRWQAAAQVLWFFDRNLSIQSMKEKMLRDLQLHKAIDFVLTSREASEDSGRGLKDVIRKICPNPRKGRPPKKQIDEETNKIITIPAVYNESNNQIHLEALRWAVVTIAQVLVLKGCPSGEVFRHPIVEHYKNLRSRGLARAICWWIDQSLKKGGVFWN